MILDKFSFIVFSIIIISILVFFWFSINLSGNSVNSGTIQIEVSAFSSINFSIESIDWGTVEVSYNSYCDLYTSRTGTTNSTGGCSIVDNSSPPPLKLINDGNLDVRVDIISNKKASDLIGGTQASFRYIAQETGNGEMCDDQAAKTLTEITESTSLRVCDQLRSVNSDDEVDVGFYLKIPNNASPGNSSATITATATTL